MHSKLPFRMKYSFHILYRTSILRIFLLAILIIAYPQYIFSQKNFEEADNLFKNRQYQAALVKYLKEEAFTKDSLQKHHALIQIANCYYEIHNAEKAANYYLQAILINDNLSENQKLNYINSLIETEQYTKAKKYLLDNKGPIFSANNLVSICDYALANQSINTNIRVNPIGNQFGTAIYGMTILNNKLLYLAPPANNKANKCIGYLYDYNSEYSLEYELNNKYLRKICYYTPSFEKEGQLLYYSKNLSDESAYLESNRKELNIGVGGSNNLGIFILDLSDPKGKSKPEMYPYINIDFNSTHPFITNDGETLYFAADIPGGYGGYDLYSSEKLDDGWSRPVNLGAKINTIMNEGYPFYDNGTLYFSSNGHPGYGGLDIFSYTKNTSSVNNLGKPINSSSDDFYFMFIEDNTGFFISNRYRKDGKDIVYQFEEVKESD